MPGKQTNRSKLRVLLPKNFQICVLHEHELIEKSIDIYSAQQSLLRFSLKSLLRYLFRSPVTSVPNYFETVRIRNNLIQGILESRLAFQCLYTIVLCRIRRAKSKQQRSASLNVCHAALSLRNQDVFLSTILLMR